MGTSKRADQGDDDAETGNEPGVSDQKAEQRKANVKRFFNGKRPKTIPLVDIPSKMDQQRVKSKR